MFRLLLVPLILLIVLGTIPYTPQYPLLTSFVTLVELFLYASIAVTIHRIVLLDPNSDIPSPLEPKKRVFKFILYTIAVGIICIPAGFLALVPVIGVTLTIFAMGYIAGRFALMFPSVAIDRELTFKESWSFTQYHHITMFLVVGVIPFIVNIPIRLMSGSPTMAIIANILSAATTVYLVTTVSVCYERIMKPEKMG